MIPNTDANEYTLAHKFNSSRNFVWNLATFVCGRSICNYGHLASDALPIKSPVSVLLAIFSYPAANATVQRHWPYFQRQEADWVYGIGTIDGKCEWPEGVSSLDIGKDSYIDGPHLPNRMLDTIEAMLLMPWDVLMMVEYDTLILKSIKVHKMKYEAACHLAGGATWGSKTSWFGHNPWLLKREVASDFLKFGRKAIQEDVCPDRDRGQPSTPECSPDVFWAYVLDHAGTRVQTDLWQEYSRNSFDVPGHLEEARQAYLNGVDCIHGLKTQDQLDFILS